MPRLPLILLLACVGCAVNPVSRRPELSLISTAQEATLGKEADRELLAQSGEVEDPKLQAYVRNLVQRLAQVSENPTPYTVRVLDTPEVNAFALPGHVYVTRGMLAHLDNEAALAGTLGHEIGHVVARHSVREESRRAILGLPLNVVEWFLPAKINGLIDSALSPATELLWSAHSRSQEEEADRLGANYCAALGYDVRELASMFRMISALEALDQQTEEGQENRVPWFYDSHPSSEDRVATLGELAAELQADAESVKTERDRYLKAIEGLMVGDDPREGAIVGGTFVLSRLLVSFGLPEEWVQTVQSGQAICVPREGRSLILIRSSLAKTLQEFKELAQASEGVELVGAIKDSEIAGFKAVRAQGKITLGDETQFAVSTAVAVGSEVVVVFGLSPVEEEFNETAKPAAIAVASRLQRLPASFALAIQPARLRVVEAERDATFEELAAQYVIPASADLSLEGLAVMNGMRLDSRLTKGQRFKVVAVGR